MKAGQVSIGNQPYLQNSISGIALDTLKKVFPETGALSKSNPTTSPIATAVGIQNAVQKIQKLAGTI